MPKIGGWSLFCGLISYWLLQQYPEKLTPLILYVGVPWLIVSATILLLARRSAQRRFIEEAEDE